MLAPAPASTKVVGLRPSATFVHPDVCRSGATCSPDPNLNRQVLHSHDSVRGRVTCRMLLNLHARCKGPPIDASARVMPPAAREWHSGAATRPGG